MQNNDIETITNAGGAIVAGTAMIMFTTMQEDEELRDAVEFSTNVSEFSGLDVDVDTLRHATDDEHERYARATGDMALFNGARVMVASGSAAGIANLLRSIDMEA